MNSRERFQTLMNRNYDKLDRIPIDFWASSDVINKLIGYNQINSKEDLLDKLDVDFRYIDGPKYIGPPFKKHSDGSIDDIWGVPRKKMFYGKSDHKGSYMTVVKNPLSGVKTIKEIEEYDHWPKTNDLDYSLIEKQCEKVRQKEKVVMFMGDRLNRVAQLKPMMYLYGIERALSGLAKKNDPIFDAILIKINEFYLKYLENILNAANGKIDVIVTGDDFGQQNGLICSPNSWRNKLLPGFKSFIQLAKKYNVFVMHHTCGSVFPIIQDMIDAGLDILNPIQPGTADMEFSNIKEKFGQDLIFHGGISLQGPLRFGDKIGIEKEVNNACNILGHKGGYIICTAHNINMDINIQNINYLFNAYEKYCKY